MALQFHTTGCQLKRDQLRRQPRLIRSVPHNRHDRAQAELLVLTRKGVTGKLSAGGKLLGYEQQQFEARHALEITCCSQLAR
ncbi:unnamed protein product [Toxocara canis]|uniref:Transcriptional regulator n=1 Tax=Toxocara canis TaxID=6265 RepID=A0A183TVA2_TOXCA|nr:unnamed protein product [Toxocara canis]